MFDATRLFALATCAVLAGTACSSANKDWESARATDTLPAYRAFLNKHANDKHAQDARTRIAVLQDESAWTMAQSGNSLDSFGQYLQAEPNGSHAQAAHDQIANFERAAAWHATESNGSQTSLVAFLQKYPTGAEADLARQKLAAIRASYRAELGSFHSERVAQRKRSELNSRFGHVLKNVVVVWPDSSSKRYRVMSGVMDKDDAASTCSSLKRRHQFCEVVKAELGQS